jgi:predicted RNA methylase
MRGRIAISPEVAAVLARATVEGNVLKLPDGQVPRPLYVAMDKVLSALGGKWDKRIRGHVFANGLGDQLTEALAAGHAVDERKANEQFFTPQWVADKMAEIVRPGQHVLEPSCGSGVLIRAAVAAGAVFISAVEGHKQLAEQMAAWMIANHDTVTGGVWWEDFMEWRPKAALPIDIALMNPPFSKCQDMRHVRRAFDFVRPGGKLVSVMSPHWKFAVHREAEEFRAWLDAVGYRWEQLPEGTFKESGTAVGSGLLYLSKPE